MLKDFAIKLPVSMVNKFALEACKLEMRKVRSPFSTHYTPTSDSLRDRSTSCTNKTFFGKQRVKIMKRISILSLMANLAILGIGAFIKPQPANAEAAPIFRPLIRDIQAQLPRGMVMRLPAVIPNPPSGIPGYRPAIISSNAPEGGYFAIVLVTSNCPETRLVAVCDTGRIFVERRNSNTNQRLRENQQQGSSISLKTRVRGFYRSYIQPTRGKMHEIIWEQDGMIFGVMSRSRSQKQVINVAISMANELPIKAKN